MGDRGPMDQKENSRSHKMKKEKSMRQRTFEFRCKICGRKALVVKSTALIEYCCDRPMKRGGW